MTRIMTFLAALMLVTGCQTTGEILKMYPKGASYSGYLTIGKKQVPLPPGEWEVFASRATSNSSGLPFVAIVLGNKDRNAEALAVRFHTNVEVSNGYGWVLLKACSRTNMHHVFAPQNIEGSGQRCWFVNHSRMTRTGNSTNVLTEALDRAKDLGVKLPVTSVYTGFRVSDTHDILTVRVYFNPETQGFEPPKQSAWATNDWHKDRIYTDNKKVAYVEKIKKWAAAYFSKVEAGFKGKLAPAQSAAK